MPERKPGVRAEHVAYAAGSGEIRDRLEEARKRVRVGGLIDAAATGLAAGLAALLVLLFWQRLSPASWAVVAGGAGLTAASLGAAAVGIAAFAAVALAKELRAPSLEVLARRADRAFDLKERASTAIEADRRVTAGGGSSAVILALLADAEGQAQRIVAAKLAAIRLPPAAYLVLVLAIAAILAIAFVPQMQVPAPVAEIAGAESGDTLGESERAAVGEDIRRVAEAVKAQAQRRSDAYMQAVANSLEALGARVAASPQTTRTEVLGELTALTRYATAAASEWRGEDGERVPRLLEALAQSVAQPAATSPDTGSNSERADAPANGGSVEQQQASLPEEGGEEGAASTELGEMLDEFESRNAARAQAQEAAGEPTVAIDYMQAEGAQTAQALDDGNAEVNLDNAQLLGPSSDARAGDSLLAGEGTDSLGSEAVVPQPVDFETSAELLLQGEDRGEGRRIELEVVPDTNFTEITEESLAAYAEGWERHRESEVARDTIAPRDRDVVSRYLRSLLGQPEP